MATETKKANMVALTSPKFLTLAGKGANRVAFRMVRSDTGKVEELKDNPSKRGDKLLAIALPSDSTEAQIDEYKLLYQITDEEYSKQEVDGVVQFVTRSDYDAENTIEIGMPKGESIIIMRKDAKPVGDEQPPVVTQDEPLHASVNCVVFDVTRFDEADAEKYLSEIDCTEFTLEQTTEDHLVARRSDEVNLDEAVTVELDEGVTAIVQRAEEDQIPEILVSKVIPVVYGHWGWDMLTFDTAIADSEYSEKSRSALNLLDDVLRNILFWDWENKFTTEEKAALIENSVDQFKNYMIDLLKSLPADAIVMMQRNDETNLLTKLEGSLMAKKDEAKDNKSEATAEQDTALMRSDFDALKTEIIGEVGQAVAAALAKRSDAPNEETVTTDEPTVTDTNTETQRSDESQDKILLAISGLSDQIKSTGESVATLTERMDKFDAEDTTTVTDQDEQTETVEQADVNAQRSDDPDACFNGIFEPIAGQE